MGKKMSTEGSHFRDLMTKMKKNVAKYNVLFLLLAIFLFGVSYAFFAYNRVSTKDTSIVAGGIYMRMINTSTESKTNLYPMTSSDGMVKGTKYKFKVEGYNESKKDISYGIYINQGTNQSGKTRLNDSDIMMVLKETKNGETKVVYGPGSLENFNNTLIYSNTINKETIKDNKVSIEYELTTWVSEKVLISDTVKDMEGRSVYTQKDFNNSYTSLKVEVVGDFTEKAVSDGEVSITAKTKSNSINYVTNLDYSKTAIVNDNVLVTWTISKTPSKLIIVNESDNTKEEVVPTQSGDSYVYEKEVSKSSKLTYYVVYTDGKQSDIGHANIRIDKETPTFTMSQGGTIKIVYSNTEALISNKVTLISDDNKVVLKYALVKKGEIPTSYKAVELTEDNYEINEYVESGLYELYVKTVDEAGKEHEEHVQYVISYDIGLISLDGYGLPVKTFEVVKGQQLNYLASLPEITREYFKFLGFSSDREGTKLVSNETIVNDIETLYANFEMLAKPVCSFSGPTATWIKASGSATYTLTCVNEEASIGFNNSTITSSDITPSIDGIVTISAPVKETLDNGYKWTITVTGLSQGEVNLTLKEGVVTNGYGVSNEKVTSDIIKVDTTAPTVSYDIKGDQIFNTSKTVTITASDNESGFDYMIVQAYKDGTKVTDKSIDKETTGTYQVTMDSNGVWTIYAKVYDKAGNNQDQTPVSEDGSYYQTYTIDTTGPTITYDVAGGTYNEDKTITVTATDAISGFDYMSVQVYKDGVGVPAKSTDRETTGTFQVTLESDGVWTVHTKAYDKVGNVQNQNPSNESGWYYQEYKIYKNHTVNFVGNKFGLSSVYDGTSNTSFTYSYDSNTSYLTINGTYNTYTSLQLMQLVNQHFTEGDQYTTTLEYVSGSYTAGEYIVFVTEVLKDNLANVSTRNFMDAGLPTSDVKTKTATLTISSAAASEATIFNAWIWSSSSITFDNYTFKVTMTKVESKTVTYNSAYGTFPSNPTRYGHTFTGWYTEETGGTQVTTSTIMDTPGDKTVYAHWSAVDVTAPKITYSLSAGNYNSTKSVTVKATDTGSGLNHMKVHVYKDGVLQKYNNNITSGSYTASLNSQGSWVVYVQAYDNAGNKAPESKSIDVWHSQTYVIDTTAPTISFDVANGASFTNPKTATVSFADNLSGVKERNVSIIKSDGTTLLSNYVAPNNTYSYTFNQIGTYTIYANAVDNAGNNYYTVHNASAMVTITITAACTDYTRTTLATETSCTPSGTPGVDNTYITCENAHTRWRYTLECQKSSGMTTTNSKFIYKDSGSANTACKNARSGCLSYVCSTSSRVLYTKYQYTRTCS